MTIPPRSQTVAPLRERPAWNALHEHFTKIQNVHLRQLFADDPQRSGRFTLEAVGIYFDYSKNRITGETMRLLFELAEREHKYSWGSVRHLSGDLLN